MTPTPTVKMDQHSFENAQFLNENSTLEKKRISRKRANKISRKRSSIAGNEASSNKDAKSNAYAAMKRKNSKNNSDLIMNKGKGAKRNLKTLDKNQASMLFYLTAMFMGSIYLGNLVVSWFMDLFKNLYNLAMNFVYIRSITNNESLISTKLSTLLYAFTLFVLFIAAKSVKNLAISEMRDYTEKHDIKDQVIYDKQWAEYIQTFRQETEAANFKSKVYTKLPWRFLSRTWGKLHKKRIPTCLRSTAYNSYIWMTGVNFSEAKNQDLSSYRNLNSFFRREILEEVRPVAPIEKSDLVSPVDGRVLSCGKVTENGMVKQVKGINYSVKTLLGPNNFAKNENSDSEKEPNSNISFSDLSSPDYVKSLLKNPTENDLFYSVIYLAPGDYHRYHSPTEWTVTHRRHFPGDLFSVNPSIAAWLKNLFALNERVALNGEWKHGFFSYSAVGASLVGSMKIDFDKQVYTSKPYAKTKAGQHSGIYFDRTYDEKIDLVRKQQIGEFNIGSTVILLFEAPKSSKFLIENGEKVNLGIPIIET